MDEAKKRVWQAPKLQPFGSLGGATLAGAGTIAELYPREGVTLPAPTCARQNGNATNMMKYPCACVAGVVARAVVICRVTRFLLCEGRCWVFLPMNTENRSVGSSNSPLRNDPALALKRWQRPRLAGLGSLDRMTLNGQGTVAETKNKKGKCKKKGSRYPC